METPVTEYTANECCHNVGLFNTYVISLKGLTELDVQRWAEHYKSEAKKTIDWTWEEDYVQKLVENQQL